MIVAKTPLMEKYIGQVYSERKFDAIIDTVGIQALYVKYLG